MALATSHGQDAFYRHRGDDLMESLGLGVQMAHLSPATDWLDAGTVSRARTLGPVWVDRISPGYLADMRCWQRLRS